MVFKIVSVFRVNSYTKNNLNLVNFAIFILVLCHISFRTCYRIASAGLLLQEEPMVDSPSSAYNLKFVGTNSRQAPGSSHFASVADRMQAHAALNSTEQLCFPQKQRHHYSGFIGCNHTEKMHCSNWPWSQTHPWTKWTKWNSYQMLFHCLTVSVAILYGPNDQIFLEGNIWQI